jgi:hypothetical protein
MKYWQIIQIKNSLFYLNKIFSQILEKYNANKHSTTNIFHIFIKIKNLNKIKFLVLLFLTLFWAIR